MFKKLFPKQASPTKVEDFSVPTAAQLKQIEQKRIERERIEHERIDKIEARKKLILHPEQIAQERIEQAAQNKTFYLDLSGLGLKELPKNISTLSHINSLNLSENDLEFFPSQLTTLVNLKSLSIFDNNLKALPPETFNLVGLTYLGVSNNKLSTLPPRIKELTNLVSLDVSNNILTSLPYEIGNLLNLTKINVSRNQLTTLPNSFGKLTKLEWIDFQENHIVLLPSAIRNIKYIKELNLIGNPIQIAPEILAKTREPLGIIEYFFAGRKQALNEVKVLVVGQGSVGKTSLIKRFLEDKFSPTENKTEGIDIRKSKFSTTEHEYTINIWDFGGQEIMHATHQFFLTKRSLYLLVLDSRLTQEENRVEYWLKIIQSFGGESPILIVGSKTDQHPLDIDRTGLQNKYPNVVGVIQTSAAQGRGFDDLKAELSKQIDTLPHVHDFLPESWFGVKSKLENFGKKKNFITQDEYIDLCGTNDVKGEHSQRTLIGFLHDLGVVLHFQDDPRLEALGILNPQWVTNGVYKILNSHTLFQNKGVLTVSMLDEILNLPEYPRGKRLFIVDMMKKFELCYDITPDKTFLVPDLLPKDQPDLKFNGVPAFEYAYPVLPSSVITRFIVRMNQKIDDGLVWRTGVVLRIGENKALVKADIEDRRITVAIDGVEHTRRDALSAIRYQLDEIHGSIKGLDAQKRVPIPNAPNAEPLEYDYLLMLEREGDETFRVKDGSRLVTINVRQILSAIESESQRKESGNRVTNIYIGGDVKDSNILAGDENEVKK